MNEFFGQNHTNPEGKNPERPTENFQQMDIFDYQQQSMQHQATHHPGVDTQRLPSIDPQAFLSGMKAPQTNKDFEGETQAGIEKRKIIKLFSMAVFGVLGGQLILAVLVFAGLSIANPGFSERLQQAFFGAPDAKTSAGFFTPANNGVVRNIVVEKTDSPIVAVAEKTGPTVVGIRVTARTANAWPFGASENTPEGSGIIIRPDGYIVTNNHVIEDALNQNTNRLAQGSKIEVILHQQKEKPYIATVVGRDQRTDLAVLKIEATNLPAIELGNSDEVKVGEMVIAIGNPGGLEYMGSVTAGIVSGLNRTIPVEDGKELKLIQTDAAINPGNSGGALVNARGQLIGINTAKIGGAGFEGLGFAIPVNKAKEISNSLIEFKYVKGRPLFGIVADPRYTESVASNYGMPVGILISEVTPFSGAAEAGIRANDIITKFAGTSVKNVNELNELKNKYKPDDTVEVEIYRNRNYTVLKVKLTEDKR